MKLDIPELSAPSFKGSSVGGAGAGPAVGSAGYLSFMSYLTLSLLNTSGPRDWTAKGRWVVSCHVGLGELER